MSRIGDKIKTLRLSHKLSQRRFGEKLGISGKTVSAYETGRSLPSLKVMENISSAYTTKKFNNKGLLDRLTDLQIRITEVKDMVDETLSF
ncbi:MAG: DNA-binding helix-turn-helix protein [candidate division WWE3 bacterium GW2011_GWB1_47_11]|uniref:DNA-binding helix-turn-helix protein n=3 Tax=Katanobacteria TaxID=422282 RepID=A0A0G1RM52_UNCKA|nr:MAG: DNA-binding helix-turn-helix protein [candidate division WWE3 bacterium GW2011_GWA2_46_9]KKU50871.1 MAG: DNA-binding helix-turn-helix protein [candidate division WWE3 bacterium GW2011_GWC1_47_10]KKU58147.1 MAG: DNA-binding helix-turn-helix protein [candidate division WWE3 bacterium GW2011_GWB1_47_11]